MGAEFSKEMMMVKFVKVIGLFLLLFTQIVGATDHGFYVSGGHAQFSDTFESSYKATVGWRSVAPDGLGLDFSTGYLAAEGELSNPKLTMVPLTAAVGYHFNPSETLSPYVYGVLSLNFLSEDFDSPGFGYGIRTGLKIGNGRYSSLFVELEQLLMDDGKTDLGINPLSLSLGFMMYLDKEKPSKAERREDWLKRRKRPKVNPRRPRQL